MWDDRFCCLKPPSSWYLANSSPRKRTWGLTVHKDSKKFSFRCALKKEQDSISVAAKEASLNKVTSTEDFVGFIATCNNLIEISTWEFHLLLFSVFPSNYSFLPFITRRQISFIFLPTRLSFQLSRSPIVRQTSALCSSVLLLELLVLIGQWLGIVWRSHGHQWNRFNTQTCSQYINASWWMSSVWIVALTLMS